MSAKRDPDEEEPPYEEDEDKDDEEEEDDDNDDDEEADFVPGADDDDDDDDDGEYADEDDDDFGECSEDPPPFLQGYLYRSSDGKITYEKEGSFRLTCPVPPRSQWSLQSPLLAKPVDFGGTVNSEDATFSVQIISQGTAMMDPLEKKLLDAQAEHRPLAENGLTTTGNKKSDDDVDRNTELKSSPGETKLKSPPSYSLKSPPPYSLKEPPATDVKKKPPPGNSKPGDKDTVFVMSGVQVGTTSGRILKFRGVFLPPDAKLDKLFLICSLQQVEQAAAAEPGTAAVARKRRRTDEDDDDDVDNDGNVAYQELIDLHDDSRLSTEELRRRYYGGGDAPVAAGSGDDDNYESKKPPASNKRAKPSEEDDDDDNDDAYGF